MVPAVEGRPRVLIQGLTRVDLSQEKGLALVIPV